MPITIIPIDEDRHVHTQECEIENFTTVVRLLHHHSFIYALCHNEEQQLVIIHEFWNDVLKSCTNLNRAMSFDTTTNAGPTYQAELENMIRTFLKITPDPQMVLRLDPDSFLAQFYRIRGYIYLWPP